MYVLRKGIKDAIGFRILAQIPHAPQPTFERLAEIIDNWDQGYAPTFFESVGEAERYIGDNPAIDCDTLSVCELRITGHGSAMIIVPVDDPKAT